MTRTMPGMPCWSKPSTTMNSLPSAKPWACAHASRNRLIWIDRAGPPLSKESKELENDAQPGEKSSAFLGALDHFSKKSVGHAIHAGWKDSNTLGSQAADLTDARGIGLK